jgi:hypothetical protein
MKLLILLYLLLTTTASLNAQSCENFSHTKTKDDFIKALSSVVQNQTTKISKIKDRHLVGSRLNNCIATENSKGLVVTFAGTASFNPRTYSLMRDLLKCKSYRNLPLWMKENTYFYLRTILKEKKSKFTKWSGIEKGPLSEILKSDDLSEKFKDYDFNVYASEESEVLAGLSDITIKNIGKIYSDIVKSVSGNPTGIKQAYECTKKYFKSARQKNFMPKLIILSHSSGARSIVKFLEKIKVKDYNINADLVISLDPVKEAQHAMGEALDQLLSFKEINVWSRKQPKSLYKTSNTKRWINFYQNRDKNGLNFPVKFGIHGSPIHNADINYYISDGLGDKAHGQITYQYGVLDLITKELRELN